MNTVSNSVSTGDIAQDPNGFAPDYEGIVPGWVQDLWAYQVGEYGEKDKYGEGTQSWGYINTPQMDSYKALAHPGSTGYGLLNPLLKVPDQGFNALTGHSAAELAGQKPYVDNDPTGLLSALMKNTPQGNWLQKLGNDNLDPESNFSFFTGLGAQRVDEARRDGEAWNSR
jgi:hypothetical protein